MDGGRYPQIFFLVDGHNYLWRTQISLRPVVSQREKEKMLHRQKMARPLIADRSLA